MKSVPPGLIAGGLAAAAAISIVFHKPALAAFFSDPATATETTAWFTAGGALVAGFLKGWTAKK